MTYIGLDALRECFACEKTFAVRDAVDAGVPLEFQQTYCSKECFEVFEAALFESAQESKSRGLVDADGNAILGGAYKQAVDKVIREAITKANSQGIGIKLPSKE